MTSSLRLGRQAALPAFALSLLAPSVAIRCGLLPFDQRFEALVIVSMLCIGLCVYEGFGVADLGLARPWIARHWLGCGAITLLLAAGIALETNFLDAAREPPDWSRFGPFYVLVSSPCQEVVCRSIPKLITDRLSLSGGKYVLFSSTVFALMHYAYGDTMLLLNCFFAGLAWATAYLVTRNVWPLAASHAAVGMFAFWLGAA